MHTPSPPGSVVKRLTLPQGTGKARRGSGQRGPPERGAPRHHRSPGAGKPGTQGSCCGKQMSRLGDKSQLCPGPCGLRRCCPSLALSVPVCAVGVFASHWQRLLARSPRPQVLRLVPFILHSMAVKPAAFCPSPGISRAGRGPKELGLVLGARESSAEQDGVPARAAGLPRPHEPGES